MSFFNKWIGMGNLCRDPELRSTPNGTAVCKFSIAVNSNFTSKDGEKREEVTFVDCEAWAKTAEIIAKYFTKGKPILLEGRLKQDSWSDRDGNKRTKLKAVVESFQFVGGKDGGQESDRPAQQSRAPAREEPRQEVAQGIDTEDVPF